MQNIAFKSNTKTLKQIIIPVNKTYTVEKVNPNKLNVFSAHTFTRQGGKASDKDETPSSNKPGTYHACNKRL